MLCQRSCFDTRLGMGGTTIIKLKTIKVQIFTLAKPARILIVMVFEHRQGFEIAEKRTVCSGKIDMILEQISITSLVTLKKRPCQAELSKVGKPPSPTKRTPHNPNVAAERARLFLGKKDRVFSFKLQKVESRVKARKTQRRQTRHRSIFRASEICFSLATSLSISKT